MNRVLLIIFCMSLFSCSSKQEDKDAAYWRMKYQALDNFVKSKGLKSEAEKAALEYESTVSKYQFIVFKNHYSINGEEFKVGQIKNTVEALKGNRSQVINIMATIDAEHEKLLLLMNELSLAGFKNFNLSSEQVTKPLP